jgi:hypothetical protein
MKEEARAAVGEPTDVCIHGAEETALLRYERFVKAGTGWRNEGERDAFVRIEREELQARGGERAPEKKTTVCDVDWLREASCGGLFGTVEVRTSR